MEITKKYVDFILENVINFNSKVLVPEPQEDNKIVYWKLGPRVYMDTTLEVIEKYTRSVKFKIKFDKYEIEQLIFIPIESSPMSIQRKLESKLEKIVYNTLIEDGRRAELVQMYEDRRKNIFIRYSEDEKK